jgi:hypothetical protein
LLTAQLSRSFLDRHHEAALAALSAMSLAELRLERKSHVVTLPGTTPALHALAAMATARVSAVGITASEGGPLIANLSARRVP